MLKFAARRAAPALAAAGAGTWAAVTTSNDDWDEYFPPAPTSTTEREKVVILGSGWAGLNALRKAASAHNRANRIFVYKRDGQNVSEDSLKSQMRSKGLSTESRANMDQ